VLPPKATVTCAPQGLPAERGTLVDLEARSDQSIVRNETNGAESARTLIRTPTSCLA